MLCDFKSEPCPAGWRHVCRRCQRVRISSTPRLMILCRRPERPPGASSTPLPPPERPPLGRRLATFSLAAIRHLVAGMPTCTQAQIDARLAQCRACLYWIPADEDRGYCGHHTCGCNLQDEPAFLNKLAWADQQCPIDRWPAVTTTTAGPSAARLEHRP